MEDYLKEKILSLSLDEEFKVNQDLDGKQGDEADIRARYFWLYRESAVNILSEYEYDLLSIKACVFGLWKAAQKYDFHQQYRFLTYAIHWLEASVEKKDSIDIDKINTIYDMK